MSAVICGWHLHCFVKLQPVCMCSIIAHRLPGLFLCGWLLFRAPLGFVFVRDLLCDSDLSSFPDSRSVSLSHLSFQFFIHPLLSLRRCHCLPFSIFLPLYSATALALTAHGAFHSFNPGLWKTGREAESFTTSGFSLAALSCSVSGSSFRSHIQPFFFSIIHEHRCSFSVSVWNPSPVSLFLVSKHDSASF